MSNQMSAEELRKQANEILKGVDQLIKAGNLDDALAQIGKAKAIDPNNAYIYAFEERIGFLRAEEQRKKGADAARKRMEEEAWKRLEEQRRRIEEERKRKEEEVKRRVEEERKRKAEESRRIEEEQKKRVHVEPVVVKAVDERQKIEEDTKRKFEEDFKRAEEENRKKAVQAEAAAKKSHAAANDPHQIYKSVLLLAWADGGLSKEEETQLKGLKLSLSISDDEDKKLQHNAQLESYAQAFKLAWSAGMNAKERGSVIQELRKKFFITAADQSKIESKLLAEIAPDQQQQQQLILVVEDEDAILKLIVQVLENSGYTVQAFSTSDDAYQTLRESNGSHPPDLILSDVNLETSSMGGFSFYEKVRQLDSLLHVPFIFLSGLTDEGMIRYGKGLGADDYLTKPFSNDLLLDTIKGKLKRFHKFRKV
ncbi:MAG: response regulator [bacterium]